MSTVPSGPRRLALCVLVALHWAAAASASSPDGDRDGLSDAFELAHGFDPANPDEDGNSRIDGRDDADADTLANAAEERAGTDPNDADSDDDGLSDGAELAHSGWDSRRVVSEDVALPWSLATADMDGDGDLDVLSASYADDTLQWFRNADGRGNFEPGPVASTSADGARSVAAVDVDGDGDPDLVSASSIDNVIAWYPNDPYGLGFGARQLVDGSVLSAESVAAGDLDGDGDPDLVSASLHEIAWHENIAGDGSTWQTSVISSTVNGGPEFVSVADVDGDGDLDVLAALGRDDEIVWYENTSGTGTFGAPQTIWSAAADARPVYVEAVDVDGDGDLDAISTLIEADEVSWHENVDGAGTFGAPQTISSQAWAARSAAAADLDGDGDPDVVSVGDQGTRIGWYENTDGAGTFGGSQDISVGFAWGDFMRVGDVDGDGDLDVLSATSYADDAIHWHERLNLSWPLDPDSDDDGLLDGDEVTTWGTEPLVADTDGDTFSDGFEVGEGTDPLDELDFPPFRVPALGPLGVGLLALSLAWVGGRRRS